MPRLYLFFSSPPHPHIENGDYLLNSQTASKPVPNLRNRLIQKRRLAEKVEKAFLRTQYQEAAEWERTDVEASWPPNKPERWPNQRSSALAKQLTHFALIFLSRIAGINFKKLHADNWLKPRYSVQTSRYGSFNKKVKEWKNHKGKSAHTHHCGYTFFRIIIAKTTDKMCVSVNYGVNAQLHIGTAVLRYVPLFCYFRYK